MSDSSQAPIPPDLQFQHAEPLPVEDPNAPRCVLCKQSIGTTYFHAQGQVVCPLCAQRIEAGQQAPPAISLGRAALFGTGAALAGCALYAAVAILFGAEIGIVAIAVGIMVGKAVRAGSKGLGGRPQQILAVLLTYFAITTSYIPVFIYQLAKNPNMLKQTKQKTGNETAKTQEDVQAAPPKPANTSKVTVVVTLLVLFAAAPFYRLTSGIGRLISLFIIFIGLRQAWRLTGRSDVLIMGPYETAPAQ